MTEDGPTPDAESDREDDGRASDARDDRSASSGEAGSTEPGRFERGTDDPAEAAGSGPAPDVGPDGRDDRDAGGRAETDAGDRDETGSSRDEDGERGPGSGWSGIGDPAGGLGWAWGDGRASREGPMDERQGAGDRQGVDAARPEAPAGVGDDVGGVDGPQAVGETDGADGIPEDVRRYDRFQKVDRASYDRVNEFLRDRTYITAREWAIARLCADFRTATGVEMTKIGENLPHLVPFMTDTYSPQAVNQARSAFEEKVRMAGATFLYGAMSGFFTADELDDIMYEVTEVAKFLLEVEGVELSVDEELDSEDRISAVMREVRRASEELRYEGVECPECGHNFHQHGAGAEVE